MYLHLTSSLRWCQIHAGDPCAARGIALQHHNLLVIPKGPEWQVVYDAKHSKGRTVHLASNTVINRHADGSFNVQLLKPTSEESLTLAARNRSFNSVLPSKRTFRASAVDWCCTWCATYVTGRRLRKKYSVHGGVLGKRSDGRRQSYR